MKVELRLAQLEEDSVANYEVIVKRVTSQTHRTR